VTRAVLAAVACAGAAACQEPADLPSPRSGGDATVFDRTSGGFAFPAPTLTAEDLDLHLAGDVGFEATFVTAPAPVHPGLGPVFNNVSCSACHLKDGRGMPVTGDGPLNSHMLVRVSTPGGDPLPGIGSQIQDHGVFGVAPEATVAVSWVEVAGAYGDGTPYALRRPTLSITLASGDPLPDGTLTSLRQAPSVFGAGLLEAIPEESILAAADPDERDGDGISGRPNRVTSVLSGARVLGRFGQKANTASLLEQAAAAYLNDIGITTSIFPAEDGSHELDDATLEATTFYTRTLAVPARVDVGSVATLAGERAFRRFGCAGCHAETQITGPSEVGALSGQVIHPYTDLLLHDMGDGLADGRPDQEASGREWKTPALWGIGLVQTVLPGSSYLHDGRARTLEEAILWHGGEAERAREAFRRAPEVERGLLVRFLRSL
jgi:CxxC motif-containing protein (DUF1111 family)